MPSSRRRKAPIGVSRSAGRVARSRIVSALAVSRLAWLRLMGSGLVIAGPRESRNDRSSPGRKVVPSAVPPSFGDAALVWPTARVVVRSRRARPWRSALPCIAGALRRSLLGGAGAFAARACRSVRRLPGPFAAAVVPVYTSHRVSLPTHDGYSSRSQPVLRDVGGVWVGWRGASSGRAGHGDPSDRARQKLRPGTVMASARRVHGRSCARGPVVSSSEAGSGLWPTAMCHNALPMQFLPRVGLTAAQRLGSWLGATGS